ncbi:MAG: RNase adapter RapZ [Betaproteobacteria bacterium]|nr:RNase adapter RapZ [Betaproteobacteria bacterium]
MQLVLITGLSGSGKSVALNVLEDNGYYYVDNLPAKLLAQTVDFLAAAGHPRVALSVELREPEAPAELPRQIAAFRGLGHDVRVLFLEAKTDTLIKRFSETRRRHPLADDRLTLTECIQRERDLLAGIAGLAHRMDTSDLGPNTLRNWVKEFVGLPQSGLTLLFESFGYKHGVPLDADLVFDARCLPNPNYDPRLRPLTGRDRPVVEFLGADPATRKLLEDVRRFIADWLPAFDRDNRSYLTVAIGCTGGQHRSVYLVEALAGLFRDRGRVLVRHRELKA